MKNEFQIQVDLDEVKRLFSLLEELHDFLHQPEYYKDTASVQAFLEEGVYEELKRMYYDVVWNWLPSVVQKEMENR